MLSLPPELRAHLQAGGALIVPSRARAQAVSLAQAATRLAAGDPVWDTPAVFPAFAWMRREVTRRISRDPARWPRLLSPAEEWYLWRECAGSVAQGAQLLDVRALAHGLRRSHERAVSYGLNVLPAAAGSEASLLFEARRRFLERCEALNAADAVTLAARLAQAAPPAAPPVGVTGFAVVAPLLRAFSGAADLSCRAAALQPARRVRVDDAREELEQIAHWCRQRIAAQPDARLLVLVPGAAGVGERLATLIAQSIDPAAAYAAADAAARYAYLEDGTPLTRVPLVSHALATLEWLAGAPMEAGDFSAWLRAVFWAQPEPGMRGRLQEFLRGEGLLSVSLRELPGVLAAAPGLLTRTARQWAAQLAHAATALGQTPASAHTWPERFRSALKLAGWPGPVAGQPYAQQVLMRWHELLEDYGSLARCAGSLSRDHALATLRGLATVGALSAADVDAPVTISTTLCDPVIRYDGIWVAGLTAEVLPAAPQADPYLPIRAQQAAGMPEASPQGRRAQARALLQAWQSGTGELVLSAPVRAGDLPLLASPLLGAATEQPQSAKPALWLAERIWRAGLTEPFLDEQGVAWDCSRPLLPGGTRMLELQNTCPFRAYAELRLGCAQPEIPEPGIAPRGRGIFLHKALQGVWEELRDSHGLNAHRGSSLTALIERCVAEAARSTLVPSPAAASRRRRDARQLDLFAAVPRPVARECRRAVRLIEALCELERARGPFCVESLEQRHDLVLAGATLRVRTDRVDRLGEGGRAVLDYKSGKRRTVDWYGDRPGLPQLLAYAQAVGDDVVAMATVSVNARQAGFAGIARSAADLPGVEVVAAGQAADATAAWTRQRQHWRAVLLRLVTDFLEGSARVDPISDEVCRYCHVRGVCRIGELRQAPESAP